MSHHNVNQSCYFTSKAKLGTTRLAEIYFHSSQGNACDLQGLKKKTDCFCVAFKKIRFGSYYSSALTVNDSVK